MKKKLATTNQEVSISSRSSKVRDSLIENGIGYDPESLLEELAELLDSGATGREKKVYKLFDKSQHALGLDTHAPVANSVPIEHRYLITEFIQRTEGEYQCKTGIEKSLAQIIALSHIRIICISKTLSSYLAGEVSVNRDINDYFTIISKELDRAHRQLTNAIMTLRQIKVSASSLNIKAHTAFISQNQQFNDYGKES
jgi:hypothetical protein